jgi:hypothetical protein
VCKVSHFGHLLWVKWQPLKMGHNLLASNRFGVGKVKFYFRCTLGWVKLGKVTCRNLLVQSDFRQSKVGKVKKCPQAPYYNPL